MPLMRMEELEGNCLRLLVYGPPGVGKTYLCGTALDVPDMLPILWVECDGGLVTVRDKLREHWEEGIKVLKLESQSDVNTLYSAVGSAKTKMRTLVIDSITELYALLLEIRLTTQGRAGGLPQLQDYGAVSGQVIELLRTMARRDDVNFICTAGEQMQSDDLTGAMYIVPDITGKMAVRAPRFFHIVGYMTADIRANSKGEIRRAVRTLQIQPYGRVYAKDRTPNAALGAALANPDIQTLYDAINGRLPGGVPRGSASDDGIADSEAEEGNDNG